MARHLKYDYSDIRATFLTYNNDFMRMMGVDPMDRNKYRARFSVLNGLIFVVYVDGTLSSASRVVIDMPKELEATVSREALAKVFSDFYTRLVMYGNGTTRYKITGRDPARKIHIYTNDRAEALGWESKLVKGTIWEFNLKEQRYTKIRIIADKMKKPECMK